MAVLSAAGTWDLGTGENDAVHFYSLRGGEVISAGERSQFTTQLRKRSVRQQHHGGAGLCHFSLKDHEGAPEDLDQSLTFPSNQSSLKIKTTEEVRTSLLLSSLRDPVKIHPVKLPLPEPGRVAG